MGSGGAAADDDDDVDDSRPECQFGLKCYRKNPQHRKDFKHTQDPDKRPKRAATKSPKKKRKAADDNDDDDDGSYDSSFIDDDESLPDLTPDESDEEEWLPSPEDSD